MVVRPKKLRPPCTECYLSVEIPEQNVQFVNVKCAQSAISRLHQ